MNIFRLSECPIEGAKFNQDLHVRKIIVEASQLLANCYSIDQLQNAPKTQLENIRKYSYYNHPLSKWMRESIDNFSWVLMHSMGLLNEFEHRFNKKHFCEEFIMWCLSNNPSYQLYKEYQKKTEQPQCFSKYPHLIVKNNPVQGYINYYNGCKLQFKFPNKIVKATWTNREIPPFIDLDKLNK